MGDDMWVFLAISGWTLAILFFVLTRLLNGSGGGTKTAPSQAINGGGGGGEKSL